MSLIVGLTGSFGSGKSAVAGLFEDYGVPAVDADQLSKEAVEPGRPALAEIVREFGPEVLGPDGRLDRPAVAKLVFADPERRRRLTAIIHPRVWEAQAEFLRRNAAEPMVVLEIPLLLEVSGRRLVNEILVVAVRENIRFSRLKRRGFSEKEVIARLGSQMPQARKIELADVVIDNNGDLEAARGKVEAYLASRGLADRVEARRLRAAERGAEPQTFTPAG